MKLVTLVSSNDVQRTVACEDINANGRPTTVRDLCSDPAVLAFFGVQDAQTVADNIYEINGSEVGEGLLDIILNSAVQEGMTIEVDLEAEDEEDDDNTEGEQTAGTAQQGTGYCSVIIGGGLQSVNLEIELGRTTIADVIHNDRVRARSGMSDAQLSACTVFVNNEEIPPTTFNTRKVNNGEQLVLSVRAVHTKG